MTQITRYDFFFDAQMKRYLQQIVRAFSGIQWDTGTVDANGSPILRIVPCRMASMNRMVAALMRNNSDNTLLSVPMITIAQTGLARNASMEGNRSHTSTVHVAERRIDPVTNKYGNERGQSYSVERLMPAPYTMTIQVDIWTSNMEQKHMILEQLLFIAGREFDIQNSDNPIDWSALTQMKLDDITLSSRSFPVGNDDEIDFATLTYSLPFWLNPPAKITRQVLIQEVVTNVDSGTVPVGSGQLVQTIITPDGYEIAIQKGIITLLDRSHAPVAWSALEETYRQLIYSGVTQLRLRKSTDDDAPEIVGVLHQTPDPTQMQWQVDIDTLPTNTIPAINAIIRPLQMSPGNGLPVAVIGQRYLIYENLGTSASWGTVDARADDIIEYGNNGWFVASRAQDLGTAIVLNLTQGTQLRWNGESWEKAIDGIFGPGYWRIFA